ncbi:MAG: 50S ribosomal protein L35 [Clostridia bacterium]
MPKLKSHSASKKRFSVTGSGKIKMGHAFRRHRLTTKSKRAKRDNRDAAYASKTDAATIKKLIPYK